MLPRQGRLFAKEEQKLSKSKRVAILNKNVIIILIIKCPKSHQSNYTRVCMFYNSKKKKHQKLPSMLQNTVS